MREQGGLIGQQACGYGSTSVGTQPLASSPKANRHRMPPRSQSSAANLTSLCADISPSSSHFFEVLYVGKIKVSHKKVPNTFIDDALEKFKIHEDNKLKEKLAKEIENCESRRNSSESTVSDSGSTDSFSTRNLLNTAQIVQSSNNNNANKENQLYISDSESATDIDNYKTKENNSLTPIIRTDEILQDTSSSFPIQKVQRTNSESILNVNNWKLNDTSSSNLRQNQTNSKSFENIALEVAKAEPKLPIQEFTTLTRKFGSAETLPTVDEDSNKELKNEVKLLQKRLSTADIIVKKSDISDHNRTMVFQVGRFDLRLISPDRKQILLHKQLKDVATCIQGLQNTAHFGFICREMNNETFMGYIFKCESESVANDVVQAIKQSFNATSEQFKRERPTIVSCEQCPMVWYHKLCSELENQNDRKTQAIIFKRLQSLEDDEQNTILAKFRGAEADTTREQNEFLMMLLRAHCEAKQMRHIHDTAENRSEFLNQYLGGSTIFMKAKRSLTNSFDHLLKRKGSRDDFGPQLKEMNLNSSREVSPKNKLNPSLDVPATELENCSPTRSRTSTISSINGDDQSPTSSIAGDIERNQLKSPMMDIFFKVGSNPKSPTKNGSPNEKSPQVTSWRQEMFNKVVTPNKNDGTQGNEMKRMKRTREELRNLWKTAIRQALLLKRMEKENDRLTAHQEESAVKRIKLEYDEISPCQRDVVNVWDQIASKDARIANKLDHNKLLQALKQGVPRSKRGEVWHFLAHQFTIKQLPFDTKDYPNYNTPYEDLLKQLTSHQHAILIDLGRTFPNHTYYSSPLGPGQLSLFNILKAYSLLDPEVGYCQGLSFVAGILLLHMSESEAFFLLRHLMFRRGMRKLYLPDMEALQVHLYQLSRLLHDKIPELYAHFSQHDVAPTLYAAPWILTIFASQFPLGFVARVFDMIFLENSDVVFRVIIALLNIHKDNLLMCDCFEEIMDYLKTTLPVIDERTMNDVMRSVFMSDITANLTEYRVEYHVLQEEMASVRPQLDSLSKLEQQNKQLMDENKRLIEQLEISVSNTQRMEQTRSIHQATINRLEAQARTLEVTVNTLGHFINSIIEQKIDIEIPGDVRRIVSQISISERRLNSTIPNMKKLEPQKYMVKSLSMSKLGLNFNKTDNSNNVPRSHSINVNMGKNIIQNLKNDSETVRRNSLLNSVNENISKIEIKGHKGYPLRVIDDNTTYEPPPIKVKPPVTNKPAPKYPLKSTLSQPILGSTTPRFFANSHNQVQQQRLKSIALKQGFKDVDTLLQKFAEQKLLDSTNINNQQDSNKNILSTEKCISLPLNMNLNNQNNNNQSNNNPNNLNNSELIKENLFDSGISTPVTPINNEKTVSEIPLFDSDVHCTFNGTTKLKSIKTGVKYVKP